MCPRSNGCASHYVAPVSPHLYLSFSPLDRPETAHIQIDEAYTPVNGENFVDITNLWWTFMLRKERPKHAQSYLNPTKIFITFNAKSSMHVCCNYNTCISVKVKAILIIAHHFNYAAAKSLTLKLGALDTVTKHSL